MHILNKEKSPTYDLLFSYRIPTPTPSKFETTKKPSLEKPLDVWATLKTLPILGQLLQDVK